MDLTPMSPATIPTPFSSLTKCWWDAIYRRER